MSRKDLPANSPHSGQNVASPVWADHARSLRGITSLVVRFRSHFANLTAFTILQAASYLIPVVTIPYFARALGIAGMGELAIAGAVALAAGVLMDYAIQLSGTRFAASHCEDNEALARYLSTTTAVKLFIFLPIGIALSVSALPGGAVADHYWVFFWSLGSAAMICLFPQWLFQGLMIMPLAARILVTCRVGAAVAAMVLVRTPDDVFLVPMTQTIGGAIALLATAWLLKRKLGIKFEKPSLKQIKILLKDNWTLFSATAWGAVYAHGGVIIMSTMLTTTSIGFYSIAQKISQALVSMFNVAAQTSFPAFVRSHARTAGALNGQVRLYMAVVVTAAALTLFAMFLLRSELYLFFAGRYSTLGVQVFALWLAASLFTVISVSLNPIMVVLRLDTNMAKVYRITGLSFLVVAPIACLYFGVLGMAATMLITECFMASFCIISVARSLRHIDASDVA